MHTVLIRIDAAKMTEKAEQDQVTRVLAKRDPDSVEILPATVIEQDGSAKLDAEESMRFMIRKCRDQILCKKFFDHVWPRWSKTWSMLEVSRLAHAGC